MTKPLIVAPGIELRRGYFSRDAQDALVAEILARTQDAPFYRPTMPESGKEFSVEETNFGPLGWISDRGGYRYSETHPVTGKPWPAMPQTLLNLWNEAAKAERPPQCCLVNLYRAGARMGLHQDKEETALDAPVISVSLGDDAVFRIGGTYDHGKWTRKGPTRSVTLKSGDVILFGGRARLAYHGIDHILAGSSKLVPCGGRINLTLRRVT